jgi:CBS domain-containing protein
VPWLINALFATVRSRARCDALHQGAFARHLTSHAIELALILEDALRSSEKPRISDYMVRNPLFAEFWQPIGFIRQQMLANSFSFLPVLQGEDWCLVSDREVAIYLRTSSNSERKRRLATPLDKTQLNLPTAECVEEETSLQDALKALRDAPLLVCGEGIPGTPKRLLGIVTAFDLL